MKKILVNSTNKKITSNYSIKEIIEQQKINEYLKIKCILKDIQYQQDCILSFKMFDNKNSSHFILGKYFSNLKPQHFEHNKLYTLVGKCKLIEHKNKKMIFFDCIWIKMGKENCIERSFLEN